MGVAAGCGVGSAGMAVPSDKIAQEAHAVNLGNEVLWGLGLVGLTPAMTCSMVQILRA